MNNKKEKIIFIIGIVIILISLIYYTVGMSVISIAGVLVRYQETSSIDKSFIIYLNKTLNSTVAYSLLLFSTLEIIYLISYLFNKKKLLLITSLINLILAILILFNFTGLYMPLNGIITLIPLVNSLIYYLLKFNIKSD